MLNKYKYLSLILYSALFVACGGGGGASSAPSSLAKPTSKNIVVNSSNIIEKSSFPTEIKVAADIGYENMVQLSLGSSSSKSSLSVSKLSTKSSVSTPTIRIIAANDGVNGEKIKRAVALMSSLLSNLDVNENVAGKTKEDIIQTMASRQATLFINETEDSAGIMSLKLYTQSAIENSNIDIQNIINDAGLSAEFDGLDKTKFDVIVTKFGNLSEKQQEAFQEKLIEAIQDPNSGTPLWIRNSQDLYFSEMFLEGDCNYLTNFDEAQCGASRGRDASTEEILHIIQAQGISPTIRTKPLQANIDAHAKNIYDNKLPIWSPDKDTWDEWLEDDVDPDIGTTYSHEYYASIVEAYYGLWRHKSAGLDGYSSVKREDISKNDSTGLIYLKEFIPEYHQYTARIQSAGVKSYYDSKTKEAVFKMHLSTDTDEKYTYKSQYLLNAQIVGDAQISLEGNDQDNILEGNSKDNVIDGKDGVDTYVVDGNSTNYTITSNSSRTIITGSNIGTDQLINMEYIHFNDKKLKLN